MLLSAPTSSLTMKHNMLVLLAVLLVFNSARIICADSMYMISPSGSISSCQPVSRCFTLSQFAANSKSYLKQNTTLILWPGNHTLDSMLLISNITKLSMKSMLAGTVNIVCTSSGKLKFQMVQYASMENMFFTHCINNMVSNVKHLMLSRVVFHGPSTAASGSAIHVNDASVTIHQCSFSFYLYGSIQNTAGIFRHVYLRSVQEMTSWSGGAIVASRSIVAIDQSTFKENRAQFGGAIYVMESNVTITNSTFDFNTANSSHSVTAAGGSAVCAVYSTIFISETTLIKNSVYYGYTLGGALTIISSKLIIANSLMNDNRAIDSGGGIHAVSSDITMINCTCHGNRANSGGLFAVKRSTLMIQNTYIGYNRAYINGGSVVAFSSRVTIWFTLIKGTYAQLGGVVYSNTSVITIQRSVFSGNLAMTDGGVIYCYKNCSIRANGSIFSSNAVEQNGGVISVNKDCYMVATGCEFFNNTASNGAVFRSANSIVTITKSYFTENLAYTEGGTIAVDNSLLYISKTTFTMNRALVGGALKVNNASFYLYSSLISNNSATRGGAMEIVASNSTLDNISITSNFGRKGVISLQRSHVIFMNQTKVFGNVGSFVVVNSIIEFLGFTLFNNNSHAKNTFFSDNHFYGGALTLINSSLTLGEGYTIFINNTAINGGAIHANMSKVNSNGRLLVYSNYARVSGGAMYFENSEVQCNGTMRFYDNVAVKRGGGIESVNSSMSLNSNCSLLFNKNWAPTGSDIIMDAL